VEGEALRTLYILARAGCDWRRVLAVQEAPTAAEYVRVELRMKKSSGISK
jgi:hypothetical protein